MKPRQTLSFDVIFRALIYEEKINVNSYQNCLILREYFPK